MTEVNMKPVDHSNMAAAQKVLVDGMQETVDLIRRQQDARSTDARPTVDYAERLRSANVGVPLGTSASLSRSVARLSKLATELETVEGALSQIVVGLLGKSPELKTGRTHAPSSPDVGTLGTMATLLTDAEETMERVRMLHKLIASACLDQSLPATRAA